LDPGYAEKNEREGKTFLPKVPLKEKKEDQGRVTGG